MILSFTARPKSVRLPEIPCRFEEEEPRDLLRVLISTFNGYPLSIIQTLLLPPTGCACTCTDDIERYIDPCLALFDTLAGSTIIRIED